MIRSMTGFGRGEAADESYRITVEVRGVNHRYLDAGIKLPRKLLAFEGEMRQWLKTYVTRGKVDVFVACEELAGGSETVSYHPALAESYYQAVCRLAQDLSLTPPSDALSIARMPDVLTTERTEEDEEVLKALLHEASDRAFAAFVQAREREGEALAADLLAKLDGLRGRALAIEARSPEILTEYREKLRAKVEELLGDRAADEARLMTEVTLFADKICTDEETVRLRSHIDAMRTELTRGGEVGRKLDFIAQEMNREANTTLSKANDLTVSQLAIECKTEIEKIREQVQNIE